MAEKGTPKYVSNRFMQDLGTFFTNELGGSASLTDDAISQLVKDRFGNTTSAQALREIEKQQVLRGIMQNVENKDNYTYGDLGKLGLAATTAHPFKSMALAGLLAGNVGGLTDGNGIGGQLLGGAGGALLASKMASNPYAQAMMVLGGGQLGSLFDKLRQKKDEESQYAQQQAQYRR